MSQETIQRSYRPHRFLRERKSECEAWSLTAESFPLPIIFFINKLLANERDPERERVTVGHLQANVLVHRNSLSFRCQQH